MEESELRPLVEGWVEHSKSRGLRIFVFGKTGVGKSSLINSLLGKEVAEEGGGLYSQTKAMPASQIYTEKKTIKTVHQTIEGVNVIMWDSPGLKDPKTDEHQTLKDIEENCKDIDIFVYCTSMTQTRFTQDECDSIRNLTRTLGDGIWKRGLIALTFANEVRPSPSSRATAGEYFRERVSEWGELLRNAIRETGVNDKIVKEIPVVPTSYRELPLPNATGADWFSAFWSACLARMRFMSLPALLQIKRGPL
jgi:predicted GTPase